MFCCSEKKSGEIKNNLLDLNYMRSSTISKSHVWCAPAACLIWRKWVNPAEFQIVRLGVPSLHLPPVCYLGTWLPSKVNTRTHDLTCGASCQNMPICCRPVMVAVVKRCVTSPVPMFLTVTQDSGREWTSQSAWPTGKDGSGDRSTFDTYDLNSIDRGFRSIFKKWPTAYASLITELDSLKVEREGGR